MLLLITFPVNYPKPGHKIKTPDAIIASTAIVNGLTLITRNTKDFKNIEGLKIIDPYEL